MVHLFLNCDDYLASQEIARLKAALGDPDLASLNTTDLTGERVTAADILAHASMMPFLCERRLVLAGGYLSALSKRMKQSQSEESAAYAEAATLLGGLASVPETCDLILVESVLEKDSPLWKPIVLPGRDEDSTVTVDGLTALARQPGIKLYALETPRDPSEWIRQHARENDVQLLPGAIRLLADFIGADLRRLKEEIEKLSLYAAKRPITPDDVRLLVSDTKEEVVWTLTDALSERNSAKAFRALNELWRDDANPFGLLATIANNYRTVLRVKTLMSPPYALRDHEEIAKRIKGKPYPTRKAMESAGRYSFTELEAIMEDLVDVNVAMVTGADQATAMELLVADLTLKPQAARQQGADRRAPAPA